MSYSKKATRSQQNYSAEDGNDEVSSRDIEKVQTLWKDIQQNKRQLEDTRTITKGASTSSLSHYVTENQELREKLRLSEGQLNNARDNIVILSKKLDEAENEIGSYHDHTTKQSTLNAMKTNQLNRMTTQYENLNLSQKEIIERSRESNIALIHELEEKNKEIENLKTLTKDRVDKLSVVSVSHDQAAAKIDRLEDDIESKAREISRLRNELNEARATISDLQQVRKSEGLAILEIEHLRSDVKRLVKMLRTTQEYSDFADFADDNSGSIRFLRDNMRQTQVDSSFKRVTGGFTSPEKVIERLCVQEALLDEKEVWVPHDAHKFAKEFRRLYKGELTDALMEKLMFELNKIWSKREQQRVQRIQAQCAHEIMKLKRKLSQSAPFNEVQAKQTINRLKGELKTSYKENRKAFDERAERNPPGIHYVNETMKLAKDSMRIKKTMTQENTFLRDQLRMTSASKSQTGFNREKDYDF